GVDRTKQAVVYKGDMKRECTGCGRWKRTQAAIAMATHATLPDRRNMLAAHLSGYVACVVDTSSSSVAREPPCGMAA
ncbi:hypothetical protein, partial [Mesorhizobium sp.]|uniref:hypothetical protein n=1 Tax=Mesorhizobium sp. TaxID=1871066 RepID=UPI0025DAAB5B